MVERIVSGGQTGVDRGALDAALASGMSCGGWCPEGREAEDGVIDGRYPLQPLPGGGYPERTRQNVVDSDGTAILYFGELVGGTALTAEICRELGKPCISLDASRIEPGEASERLLRFCASQGIRTLNVAGPRASEAGDAYRHANETVTLVCRQLIGR